MSSPGHASASRREVVDRLTSEQAARFEMLERPDLARIRRQHKADRFGRDPRRRPSVRRRRLRAVDQRFATHDEEFQAAQARELATALLAVADETERLG